MLQKTLDTIIAVLKFVGGIPSSIFPDRLKGFRTVIFNLLTALLVITESLDWSSFAQGACDLILWATSLAGIPWECSADGVGAAYVVVVGFLNMALRAVTDSPLGNRQSPTDVKLVKTEEQLVVAVENKKAVLEGNRLLIRKIEKLEAELEANLSNAPVTGSGSTASAKPVRRRKSKSNGKRK